MWVGILGVAFAAVGFAFFGLDRIEKKTKNNINYKNFKLKRRKSL